MDDTMEDNKPRRKSKKGKKKDSVPGDGTTEKKGTDEQLDGQTKGKGASQEIEENGSSMSTHSKKKKKSKNVEEASNGHTGVEPIQPEIKKRKRDVQDDTTEPDSGTRIKKKARKAQKVQQEARKSPSPTADNEKTKKREKKKEKKKSSSKSTTKTKTRLEEIANEKPETQKKRKNKTGFPDPEEDVDEEELSDQAKKALSYAFAQFHEPDFWKFNKARQNWLIRNFWSSKAIPEKYDGLVIKYLSAVQGKARENLIKTCREVVTQPPSDTGQDPQKPGASLGGSLIDATSPITPTEDGKKKARAQALLQTLVHDALE